MTLLTDTIFEELAYSPTNDNINFNISAVSFVPQDVDESLKVFIREDARQFLPISVNITTNQINLPNHAFSNSFQSKVLFTTDNIAPNGLSSGTEYFAQYVDKDHITLSLTSGGTPIDITSQGIGTHKIAPIDPNGIQLNLNTDYTITKNINGQPTKITFVDRVMQSTQKLFVVRESNTLQEDVDYEYGTPWQPVEYETHVDKIYAILQEQGNKISRAMLTRIGDTSSASLVFPAPQDNSAVGWYSIGSGRFAFRNYDLSVYATQAQLNALASLVGDTVDMRGKISIPNPFADKTIVPKFNSQSCSGVQINVGTDSFNILGHGFATDDPVLYTTAGDPPSPLVNNTTYYVLKVDDDNFKLQANPATVAITITDQGANTTDTHQFDKTESVSFTSTAHALLADEKVTYKATTAATGLTVDTSYYVIVVDANTISLAATAGGAAITVTSAGSNDQVVRTFNTNGTYSTGISVDSTVATSVSIEFEGYRKIDAAVERYMGTLKYLYDGVQWQRASEKFDVVEGTPTILFEHAAGSTLSINLKALGLSGVTYDDTSYLKFIGHQLKV